PREEPAFWAGSNLEFPEVEAVILFPAVDLKNGQCVRLEQGDMARATVFNLDPADQARSFAEQGFEYLHVVDLDGAFAGKPMNALAVEAMLKAVTMPVQLGGGIRDLKTIEAWLDKGIARVIIGTAAVRDPELVKSAAKEFPGRVAVGLDARDGKVAVEGWAETSQVTALEIAARFEDAGVAAIIFTDIARDGLVKGVNFVDLRDAGDPVEAAIAYDAAGADELCFLDITATHENRGTMLDVVRRTAEACFMPLTVGGGVRTLDDIKTLLRSGADKVSI